MSARRLAFVSVAVWLGLLVVLAGQVLELDDRLVYSEEAFIPKDSEGYRGFVLLRDLGYAAGDYMLVIYSPGDLNTSARVEEIVKGVFSGYRGGVYGPYSVYMRVYSHALGNLSSRVSEAVKFYGELSSLGLELGKKYGEAVRALNYTYGLADSYLKLYYAARSLGVEDPAGEAYRELSQKVSGDPLLSSLLLEFHRRFVELEHSLGPEKAARESILSVAREYGPGELYSLLERFDLTNYANTTRVAEYMYNATGVAERGVSFQEFTMLLEGGERGALELIASRLKTIDTCLASAFEEAVKGVDARSAVELGCREFLRGKLEYPNVIPESVRRILVSENYAIVYVDLEESLPINVSESIIRELDERLRGVVSEAYYYGTIPLFSDLSTIVSREVRRIDVTTSFLVVALLIILLRSLAAPVVILLATGIALIVSMGLLSLAALYTDVYYMARFVMIPLVFGITVDYSVFYLFRVAEERSKGLPWGEAVYHAWRRAGRALVLGGIAVVLGFLAYVLTPQEALRGVGIALAIAAAVSFLSSYTLLPSLLMILGEDKVFWPLKGLRVPAARQAKALRLLASKSLSLRYVIAFITIIVLVAGALYLSTVPPSANVHLGLTGYSRFLEAGGVLYTNFPKDAFSTIFIIAPEGSDMARLIGRLEGEGLIVGRSVEARGGYLVASAGLKVDPLDDTLFQIIPSIRSVAKSVEPEALIAGFPALRIEVVNEMIGIYFKVTLPLAVVLILAYLVVGMGSIITPLRFLITVFFSAVVSLVVATIVFHGVVEAPEYGSFIRSPIYWITPIVVLGLMITLGMDYDIFIGTRIREEYEKTGNVRDSILEAIERTGVVITVAGLILAGAFSSLLFTEVTTLRQVGFTVAFSILLDTFIVRPFIVPAMMAILGKYNWWPNKGLIRRWD